MTLTTFAHWMCGSSGWPPVRLRSHGPSSGEATSSMDKKELRNLLTGGDRRSIGKVDVALSKIKVSPSSIQALLQLMRDTDPVVSMRAADALEKASRTNPEILMPHKHSLLGEILQMLPRLQLTKAERRRAFEIAGNSLQHQSRIVVADALSAMFKLSAGDPDLMSRARDQAARLSSSSSAAVRSRAKRLLAGR